MKNAEAEEDIVQRVLTSFVCDYEAGRNPDPERYAARCPSAETRARFRLELDEYMDLSELLPEPHEVHGRIGPYRIESELGRGGMAQVFEVWDDDLNRSLAMKVSLDARLNADGSVPPGREAKVARFLQEAQITSQLRHPGIAPVHRLGVDSRGHIYFTMQLIEQDTLTDIFGQLRAGTGGWTTTKVVGVLLKVCEAVAYAHRQEGVIHRDLKPRNVMVGRFGEVYVLDWGLAKFLNKDAQGSLGVFLRGQSAASTVITSPWGESGLESVLSFTQDGHVIGTPYYMSPEQAEHETHTVDGRTDVYSVGAILYELLAGHAPYDERRPSEEQAPPLSVVLQRLLDGPPKPLSQVAPGAPAELASICEKAMERDVERRYGSMVELRDDLQAYLENRVVKAHATGALAEAKKWVLRNRGVASAVGVALLAVVALVGFALESQRRELRQADAVALSALLVKENREVWAAVLGGERIAAWVESFEELLGRMDGDDAWDESGGLGHLGAEVAQDLARLGGPPGALARMRSRLDLAERIEELTVSGEQADTAWKDAAAFVRSSDAYGGIELTPRLGLLPLGVDPRSGLYEFVDLQTGLPPELDPATNERVVGEETGVVFVLVPGGDFAFGPPGASESRSVPPFLISKYELTQGQWQRMTGDTRGQFGPGSTFRGRVNDLSHPVELVSWEECSRFLEGFGFALPTEVEWEYAARARSTWDWSTGPEYTSLEGHANLADRSGVEAGLPIKGAADTWPDLDDGFAWTAPVGSLLPNAFGLHDVHGNVFEWCADEWTLDSDAVVTVGEISHAIRGGGWNSYYKFATSHYRLGAAESTRRASLGARPVLRVTPNG
ncbi:MAG: bifunctional serine/threonine-protein kinase/formylglycine-generating enzyme family protein [Planctomycetota bacterium]